MVARVPQVGLGVGEDDEVVHVAQVAGGAEGLFDVVVHRVEVDVRPELAGEVADRKPARSLEGGKEVVAGEVERPVDLGARAVDDEVAEAKRVEALDLAPQKLLEDGVIDRGEVLLDVAFEEVARRFLEPVKPYDRAVCPLADATRVRVGDEASLEDGLENAAQRVMDNSVSERGRRDEARFGLVDGEGAIRAGFVAAGNQLVLEARSLFRSPRRARRNTKVLANESPDAVL